MNRLINRAIYTATSGTIRPLTRFAFLHAVARKQRRNVSDSEINASDTNGTPGASKELQRVYAGHVKAIM
jgi:hypothetical protein